MSCKPPPADSCAPFVLVPLQALEPQQSIYLPHSGMLLDTMSNNAAGRLEVWWSLQMFLYRACTYLLHVACYASYIFVCFCSAFVPLLCLWLQPCYCVCVLLVSRHCCCTLLCNHAWCCGSLALQLCTNLVCDQDMPLRTDTPATLVFYRYPRVAYTLMQ
jgi:hypothetical protein